MTAGQLLPTERELCIHFGASRSSLREALRCLSIMGVLNARVGEGTSVAADGGKFLGKVMEWRMITEKHDIENLLEVRKVLEALAAANVATQGTAEDLSRLEKLFVKMEPNLQDKKGFAALDLEFHLTLAKASGNTLLIDLISMIRSQLARAVSKVLATPNAILLSHEEHRALLGAIRSRDAAGATAVMHSHLQGAITRYAAASHPIPNHK